MLRNFFPIFLILLLSLCAAVAAAAASINDKPVSDLINQPAPPFTFVQSLQVLREETLLKSAVQRMKRMDASRKKAMGKEIKPNHLYGCKYN